MALVSRWNDDWLHRDPFWNDRWNDRFSRDWDDWPRDWPRPRDIVSRFRTNSDRWWKDWPTDWPRMDTIMPRFSSHLDRFDRNWRDDEFWRGLYPRWAEPIFKDGLDVRTNITNDRNRFAVEIDAYQFRPEELEVKTLDDTLLIEGRHEDVRDRDNYTKMYFVRKYQLPSDVHPQDVSSSIDSAGRLTVEARKPYAALEGRERVIPIEGSSKRIGSRSSSYSPRQRNDSGHGSLRANDENAVVRFIKTPCRFVNEKLEERKRKKKEANRLASYPQPRAFEPLPPLPYEPKPDYEDTATATYTPLDWRDQNPDLAKDRYYRSESRGANGYRDNYATQDVRNGGRYDSYGDRADYRSTPPTAPVTTTIPVQTTRESYSRSASRSSHREYSDGPNGYFVETRSASRGPGDFRSQSRSGDYHRDENLLRPEPELGERSTSRASGRSVRIERREQRYS
ncbi:Hsp-43 [Aphelenchoides besseyi]|nr:Hsp-43 [Aphelenchoides besseyi]